MRQTVVISLMITAVALTTLIVALGGCNSSSVAPKNDGPTGSLYVLNQNDSTLYVYDAATLTRIDSVHTVVPQPHHMEFSPNHDFFYVVSRFAPGRVAKFNIADNSFVDTLKGIAGVLPTAIAVSATGDTGFITNYDVSQTTNSFIYRVNLTNMTLIDSTLQTGIRSHDIKITHDGKQVIAASYSSDNITVINTETFQIDIIDVDPTNPFEGSGDTLTQRPFGLAIDKNDSLLYVACPKGRQVRIFDITTSPAQYVGKIDIPVAGGYLEYEGPAQLKLTPDGKKLYVATYRANSVVAVDVETRKWTADIPVGTPWAFAVDVSDDGSRAYVSCVNINNGQGKVYVLDTSTDRIVDSIQVGKASFMLHYHNHH
ncbi:MAG: beta-propeller fold lactonase family protein [Candidatus Zixiibacteriota bacterium]